MEPSPTVSPRKKGKKKGKMKEQAEEERLSDDSEVEPVQLHMDQASALQRAVVHATEEHLGHATEEQLEDATEEQLGDATEEHLGDATEEHLSQGSPDFNPDDWPDDGVNIFSYPAEPAAPSAPSEGTPRKLALPPPIHKRKMQLSPVKSKPDGEREMSDDEDLPIRNAQDEKKNQAYQDEST